MQLCNWVESWFSFLLPRVRITQHSKRVSRLPFEDEDIVSVPSAGPELACQGKGEFATSPKDRLLRRPTFFVRHSQVAWWRSVEARKSGIWGGRWNWSLIRYREGRGQHLYGCARSTLYGVRVKIIIEMRHGYLRRRDHMRWWSIKPKMRHCGKLKGGGCIHLWCWLWRWGITMRQVVGAAGITRRWALSRRRYGQPM